MWAIQAQLRTWDESHRETFNLSEIQAIKTVRDAGVEPLSNAFSFVRSVNLNGFGEMRLNAKAVNVRRMHTPGAEKRERLYKVTITHGNPFADSVQIPTFYLDENVQGITGTDDAKAIAREILNPANNPLLQFSIHAEKVD